MSIAFVRIPAPKQRMIKQSSLVRRRVYLVQMARKLNRLKEAVMWYILFVIAASVIFIVIVALRHRFHLIPHSADRFERTVGKFAIYLGILEVALGIVVITFQPWSIPIIIGVVIMIKGVVKIVSGTILK